MGNDYRKFIYDDLSLNALHRRVSVAFRLLSISGLAREVRVSGVRRCLKTIEGFRYCCSACYRPDDAPPRFVLDNDRLPFPSQGGVPSRNQIAFRRTGVLGNRSKHIRRYLSAYRHAIARYVLRALNKAADVRCCFLPFGHERIAENT